MSNEDEVARLARATAKLNTADMAKRAEAEAAAEVDRQAKALRADLEKRWGQITYLIRLEVTRKNDLLRSVQSPGELAITVPRVGVTDDIGSVVVQWRERSVVRRPSQLFTMTPAGEIGTGFRALDQSQDMRLQIRELLTTLCEAVADSVD